MDDNPIALPAPAADVWSESRRNSRAQTGELTRELSGLYDELAPSLLRYSAGISHDYDLANEGVQETFFRYFLQRQQGLEINNTKTWMFRVLRNVMFDLLKDRSGNAAVELNGINDIASTLPTAEDSAELAQLKARLPALLSKRELECVQLRAEGLRYDEIAAALNLTSGRVGAILSGATEKLRRALG